MGRRKIIRPPKYVCPMCPAWEKNWCKVRCEFRVGRQEACEWGKKKIRGIRRHPAGWSGGKKKCKTENSNSNKNSNKEN